MLRRRIRRRQICWRRIAGIVVTPRHLDRAALRKGPHAASRRTAGISDSALAHPVNPVLERGEGVAAQAPRGLDPVGTRVNRMGAHAYIGTSRMDSMLVADRKEARFMMLTGR